MDAYTLAVRNTEEIVTNENLRHLINKPQKKVYCGYEPSGEIHLGHLTTINKLVDLQNAGFEIIVLLADVHAFLNRKGTMEEIHVLAEYNKRCFQGLGLTDIQYVLGTEIQFSSEYQLLVHDLAQQVTVNRAKRSMDEVGRQMDHPTVSQMLYPIMQMADIAMLGVDAAVGGIDQRKIHMLAREYLPGKGYPSPVCIHLPIINGIDGKKMSSSLGNDISIAESEESIRKKMGKAYCPPNAEENPVLQILQYHIFPRVETVTVVRSEKFGGNVTFSSYEEIEKSYLHRDIHAADLKETVARHLIEILTPVRKYLATHT